MEGENASSLDSTKMCKDTKGQGSVVIHHVTRRQDRDSEQSQECHYLVS